MNHGFYSLQKGDTIGVAAPSARFDDNLLQKGIQCLKMMGFRVYIPESIYNEKRYLAGADRDRAKVVNDLFSDPRIKGIISARGGFGAMRMLGYLDWGKIKDNPTLFMGFSDATSLISSLIQKAGFCAVHGPNLVSLAKAGQATLDGFYRAVTGQLNEISIEGGQWLVKGKRSGPLLGGNLATLVHLIGTRFSPEFHNGILFIEDIGEPAYKIDRMLSQMKMAGLFDHINGVVAGSFEGCANSDYIPEILSEIFNEYQIPVCMGLDAGHGPVNLSLPMGVHVTLDSEKSVLTWDEN